MPYERLQDWTIINYRSDGQGELDKGRIGGRLMRNEAELAIVVGFAVVVMVQRRNYPADHNHFDDDGNGKDAGKP